jgi:NarL family two-component system sensor histidine kinase YdfH
MPEPITQETKTVQDLQETQEEARESRPFFLVFLFVLVAMYTWSLYADPSLRAPIRLIPFTLLAIIHGALYLFIPYLPIHRRRILPYLIVQGLLIFGLNLFVSNQGLLLGLYLALSGAATGILEDLRRAAIPLAGYMALATTNFVLSWGTEGLFTWFTLYVPMLFFVVIYVTLFDRQVKARQHSQRLLQELEAAHQQLAQYSARVEDLTLRAERQRMARELHDTLAQGLAGLILQLEAVDSHLERDQAGKAHAIVQQAMARARVTLADARSAIQNLRDEIPSADDLHEAVHQEAKHFTNATGIPCEIEMELPRGIPPTTSEHVWRTVMEGLTNVARHAQASRVWLTIHEEDGTLEFTLRDNGMGFDPSTVNISGGHYGIIGLRERARLAGGTLELISKKGEGTTLTLRLPLDDERANR